MKRMIIIRPEHTHPDGVKICDESTQKLGSHGATPTVKRAGASQQKLVCNLTAQSSTAELVAEIQSLTNLANELRDALVEKGLIKGSE